MRISNLNTILVIMIIEILPKLEAFSDSSSIDQATTQMGQQSIMRKQMSCFVCSTMDYENTADNLCRSMPKPNLYRPSTGLHQQPVGISHHPSSMGFHQPPSTTTTTTSTPSTTTTSTQDDLRNTPIHEDDFSSTHSDSYSRDYSNSSMMTDNDVGGQPVDNDPGTTTAMMSHQISSSPANNQPPHQRINPQSNPIRTRPCSDDENFCSVVSVVRVEFINDSLVSRFWAMERNCSKSCNTGCMLIGERVRLRVCSQCCRTPNCNVGSGAHTAFNHLESSYYLIVTGFLLLSLIFMKQH